jgi:hypothetical protein
MTKFFGHFFCFLRFFSVFHGLKQTISPTGAPFSSGKHQGESQLKDKKSYVTMQNYVKMGCA